MLFFFFLDMDFKNKCSNAIGMELLHPYKTNSDYLNNSAGAHGGKSSIQNGMSHADI